MTGLDNTISVSDATKIIDSGEVFSAVVCTLNISRKTGGEWMHIIEAKKWNKKVDREPTEREKVALRISSKKFIRTIVLLDNGKETEALRTIHPALLKTFNGKEVIT